MTPEEAATLVKTLAPVCKEHGVKAITVAGVSIEFGADRVDPEEAKAFQGMLDRTMPTDEDALYYSSPDYVTSWERKTKEGET